MGVVLGQVGSYTSDTKTDPMGAPSGTFRVICGGSWNDSSEYVRSVFRINYYPSNRYYSVGFRVSLP